MRERARTRLGLRASCVASVDPRAFFPRDGRLLIVGGYVRRLPAVLSVEVRCYISCVNTVVAVIYNKSGRD